MSLTALLAGMLTLTDAKADGPADEQEFLQRARGLPMYVLPKGRYSTDADILAGGYRVCALLDQYPDGRDTSLVERLYYHGGNTTDGQITYDGEMFFLHATQTLCKRHENLFGNY